MRDSLITASSEQLYAESHRARLNLITLDPIVSGLSQGFSGGWRSSTTDAEPWLQVSLIVTQSIKQFFYRTVSFI